MTPNIRIPPFAAINAAVRMAGKIAALEQQLGVKLTPVNPLPVAPWQRAAFEAAFARMQRLCPFPTLEMLP